MVFNRSTPMTSISPSRGITLVEAACVLAVCAITATTAAPQLRQVLDQRRLVGAAAELASDLQLARNAAIARNQTVRWTWQVANGCYVLHTGTAAQCACRDAGPAVCQGGAMSLRTVRLGAADRLTLQTNASSIAFDPLHGTVSPTATLRLIGADGRAIHHVVNVMGRVRSCSPAAAVAGQLAC
jgi:type IV fimbrial biogenesis protein FimT